MLASRTFDFLRDYFLLSKAHRIVRQRAPERQIELRRWYLAARARIRVAAQLSPETELFAAAALYREGLAALVVACCVALGSPSAADEASDIRVAWTTLERIWPQLGLRPSLQAFDRAKNLLCRAPRVDDVAVSLADARVASHEAARLIALLERWLEPRTLRQLAWSRFARTVPLVAALLVASPMVLGSALATRPENLALHRPVTQSSFHPSAVTPRDGLVNGKIEFAYGAHTDSEDDPWMLVDLERAVRVGKIVVHNRGDGWFTECLPLSVEVGLEASSLRRIATRNEVFTSTNPWVIGGLDETIRYVRVRRNGHGYMALSEVAVYGR